MTSLPGVFAGGDIVRGAATVILAMGDGSAPPAQSIATWQPSGNFAFVPGPGFGPVSDHGSSRRSTISCRLAACPLPSGYEFEAQKVFDEYVRPAADEYAKDALGNRLATLNPGGDPVLMFAGHMDELGLIITYVNKDGFVYFDTIGGHDRTVISGRRVIIQTAAGPVKGVTGKRAIHLMDESDRKKVRRFMRSGSISAPVRNKRRWNGWRSGMSPPTTMNSN